MRIGVIDASNGYWLAGRMYIDNLLAALDRRAGEVTPVHLLGPLAPRPRVLFAGTARETRSFGYLPGRPIHRRLGGAVVSLARGRWPGSLRSAVRRAALDVVFPAPSASPGGVGVAGISWVPDYQNLHHPQNWPDERYRTWLEQTTLAAPDLVVSSEAARADAARFFGRTERVHVLRFSIVPRDPWYATPPGEVARRYGLPDRFLVFPSQFWAHKDHGVLLDAVQQVRAGGLDVQLVLCGRPDDSRAPGYARALAQRIAGMQGGVRFLGPIPRADVIALLRSSIGVVQPSRFEGWSALVEEARTLAKPLIVSDIPVHREQDPPDARFFPVGDTAALAAALALVWDGRGPGWDPEAEAAGRERAEVAAEAFGRRFCDIAAAAVGAQGARQVAASSGGATEGRALLIWRTGETLRGRIERLGPAWTAARFAPTLAQRLRGERGVDVDRPLPFADGAFGLVYVRRILEHLAHDEAAAFLSGCRRILAPSGVLRVSVPDTERDLRAYLAAVSRADADPTPDAVAEVHAWRMLVTDQYLRRVPGGALGPALAAGAVPAALIAATYGEALGPTPPLGSAGTAAAPAPSLRQRLRELARLLAGRRWVLEPRASRESHVALWDRVSLPELLQAAGFEATGECSHRTSWHASADLLALDTAADGVSAFEPSLVFEARRGAGS